MNHRSEAHQLFEMKCNSTLHREAYGATVVVDWNCRTSQAILADWLELEYWVAGQEVSLALEVVFEA